MQQIAGKTQASESPYVYNRSVHDNAFNFYEAGASNPNNIKQRFFQHHYRHVYPQQ